MRVDPAADEQGVRIAVVEERVVARFRGVAGVACGVLGGEDEMADAEGVGHDGAAEDAAGFEVAGCVGVREVEEVGAQVRGEEDGAERGAGFGGAGWGEGVAVLGRGGWW